MAEGDIELGPVYTDAVQLLCNCDEEVQLLLKHDEEVQNRSDQRPASIFMVPKVYRELSPRSYTPQVVSIGPLHHEDKDLKGFEVRKATYMHYLLHTEMSRINSTPDQILKECVMRVSGLIDRIKACYIGMQAYSDSELVKMMVTDACFILAFLFNGNIGYSSLRPIESLLRSKISLDMVLIENQIPFFVLEDIFECTLIKIYHLSLADLIISRLQNWCNIFKGDLVMGNSCISSTHDHILGFIHKSYQNPDHDSSKVFEYPKPHSAVELYRSGVKFSNKLGAKWPMAMELKYSRFQCFPFSWSKPTLKMPTLKLTDSKESIIRNLIIYEHSSQVQTCVTSYMLALDKLIDTPEDVAMLMKSQVIVSYMGSNEEATNLINNMLKEVVFKDFLYQDEWKQMDEYYNAKWPKFIAELRRTYFNNPWSIIALIAGIVLFVLTVVQTVYGVKAGVMDSKAA